MKRDPLFIDIAAPADRFNQRLEGPTAKQIAKARRRRAELVAQSAAALDAGDDELAFELDCKVFDLDADFAGYADLRPRQERNR